MAVRHPHSTASHACIIRMPPMPMRPSVRQVPRRRSQILGLEDGRSGLDLPGGQIGVSLLTGAEFGDRMKKIISEFFVLDFMRIEKFREHIV